MSHLRHAERWGDDAVAASYRTDVAVLLVHKVAPNHHLGKIFFADLLMIYATPPFCPLPSPIYPAFFSPVELVQYDIVIIMRMKFMNSSEVTAEPTVHRHRQSAHAIWTQQRDEYIDGISTTSHR